MPRPPILPAIDWKSVFHAGKEYQKWLADAENRDHAKAMDDNRNDLTVEPVITGLLRALPRAVHVIAIAEDWCGDVVRHVPVLQRMAEEAPNLHVRYIAREDNPDAFARFLTNGGEAIPKFIFLNDQFVECGHWGPMPEACRELVARGKACGDVSAAREKVTGHYNADPNKRTVFQEIAAIIDIASTVTP